MGCIQYLTICAPCFNMVKSNVTFVICGSVFFKHNLSMPLCSEASFMPAVLARVVVLSPMYKDSSFFSKVTCTVQQVVPNIYLCCSLPSGLLLNACPPPPPPKKAKYALVSLSVHDTLINSRGKSKKICFSLVSSHMIFFLS